ncbi:unnamed protein product [Didymodactylos carnosus]|uniref:NAD(P)(+)--arginine ADP-ribosyltransferase n=1 Tax=Didymodactylos carnosus TaxID=1234261 RepID=A0A815W1V2_9BILA|nr:unnamed protein product [Didymodactylos carnosus]CAF1542786.1 unnamed protein product [Didymodactylos carnosus]CAF3851671.1 unnamed protein product [Didymodactylos carnosus]CAF4403249.1 unnamed protein product [Didymodactylos carnosus]
MSSCRYTDGQDEPVDKLLIPIKGYQDQPLLPLEDTVRPIAHLFIDIQDYVYTAKQNCKTPTDGLTPDESAAIYLYTMEFDSGLSIYHVLNESLRSEKREILKPWFRYLKLFLTGLHKLSPQPQTVFRGVKGVDLSTKYCTGVKFTWWGVSSCTTTVDVLNEEHFLGQLGTRTLFSIDCLNGKSIKSHSFFGDKEQEIILMPGSYFEVCGQLKLSSDLHMIQLKERKPPIDFVKPPFEKISGN